MLCTYIPLVDLLGGNSLCLKSSAVSEMLSFIRTDRHSSILLSFDMYTQ